MVVQLMIEAVAVYLQANMLNTAILTLQELRNTSNSEWQGIIREDPDQEGFENKVLCV